MEAGIQMHGKQSCCAGMTSGFDVIPAWKQGSKCMESNLAALE